MLKNISKETKENLKIVPVVFLVMLAKIFFETIENGLTSPAEICLSVAAALAFTAYTFSVITEKGFQRISAQSIFVVATLVITLGFVVSYRLISMHVLMAVLFASLMIIFSQRFCTLPVAALLSVLFAVTENRAEINSLAMNCVPAAIGVSLVYLSDKIKGSKAWQKIVLAVAELIMIASAVRVLYVFRFTITFHSFVTQMWDSIASFVAIAVLVILAVISAAKRKTAGEVFGYLSVAVFGVFPTFMDMKFPLVSAMTMFMMLTACAKEGMTADSVYDNAVKSISSKFKKETK